MNKEPGFTPTFSFDLHGEAETFVKLADFVEKSAELIKMKAYLKMHNTCLKCETCVCGYEAFMAPYDNADNVESQPGSES